MTIGDGLACISAAIGVVGVTWAAVWHSVRSTAIRTEALRNIGPAPWTAKTRRPA